MNTLMTRWNPQKEIEQMQNLLSSFWNWDPFHSGNGGKENLASTEWSPRVDIVEDENEFVIKAELPEMKKEDVKVTVDAGVLTISGERRQEKEERSFTLPATTSGVKVAAEFKDGMLKVHLPKDVKAASSKNVEIK